MVIVVFIGMDHGTTGISFCIMSDEGEVLEVFKIGREESKKGLVSATEEITKRVDLKDVKLMAITYAMGDGINQILPTNKVEDRGILSIKGAGKVTGGGTSVFSELESLDIDSIMIPGLHKDSTSLNELFNAAYSHQASPEKVSICYNGLKETGWSNFIVADIFPFNCNNNGIIRNVSVAWVKNGVYILSPSNFYSYYSILFRVSNAGNFTPSYSSIGDFGVDKSWIN